VGRVISTALQFIDAFTKPSAQAIKSMKKLGKEIQNTGKMIQNAGKMISSTGSSMTKSITLPIAGVATAALKMSNDFENAMSKVSTIADTTIVPMETLKKQVIGLSNEVGIAVADLAEAQYQAISAGIDTASSVDFVSIAVKAAKGGFTDTTTAVDGLTTILNAYGFEASKAASISDQMLMAQNFGKTSFGDMASSMGKVIPIASSLNVSTEELFSSVAVLTKNGIATSEAVTGLKAAYSNILKPSTDASKVAQQLGLDFSSAHLQSVGWAKFLDEIKEKTNGNADVMARLFGSTEALNSITVLAGKGSADFAKALNLMAEAGGATQAAYEKMLTPTERMNISINKLKNSLIQFGVALTPVFEKISEMIGKSGDRLNGLRESQVNAIVKIGAIAAAAGPALMVFGKMVTIVGGVTKVFGTAIRMIGNFGGVVGLITSPAGIVIGILAAISLAAILIIKNWDQVKSFLHGVGEWFKNAFEKAGFSVEGFNDKFHSIGNTIRNIAGKIGDAGKTIAKIFQKDFAGNIGGSAQAVNGVLEILAGFAVATFYGITVSVEWVVKALDSLVTFLDGAFRGRWDRAAQAFRNSIKSMFPPDMAAGLIKAFDKALPTIKIIVSGIKIAFKGIVKAVRLVLNAIAALGRTMKNLGGIKGIITILGNVVKKVMARCGVDLNKFGSTITSIKTKAGNAIRNIMSIFGVAFTIVGKLIKNAVNLIRISFGLIVGIIKKAMAFLAPIITVGFHVVLGVISSTVNTIASIIEGLVTVFNGLTTFLAGVFTGNWKQAWEGIKMIFSGVFSVLGAICKQSVNAVIGIINGAIAGINKIGITIPDWVPGMGGKAFSINVPPIPMLYKGTNNWKGGTAIIHDRGGEIVDLPKGTRVYPHDKSVEMARKEGERRKAGYITIHIQKLADKIEVRKDEDIDRIAEALVNRLRKVAFNTGTA